MHKTIKKLFLYILVPCMIFYGLLLLCTPPMAAFTNHEGTEPVLNGFPIASALESVPRKTVRTGFFAFGGYHMLDKNDVRSGYGYEFLQLLGRYTNWKYEYVGYDKSWEEMQQMLTDGEIDLLTSAGRR